MFKYAKLFRVLLLAGVFSLIGGNSAWAANSWTGAQTLSDFQNDGGNQSIDATILANGDSYQVWAIGSPAGNVIRVSKFTQATQTWGTAETLANTGTDINNEVKIAADSNGNLEVLYVTTIGVNMQLNAIRYSASTHTWGTPTNLTFDGLSVVGPQIAADASGNFVAIWEEWVPQHEIHAANYSATSNTWTTETRLDTSLSYSFEPQIVYAGNSTFLATWSQDNLGTLHVNYAYFDTTGSGWSGVTELSSGPGEGARVASVGDGKAVVAYRYWTGSIHEARVRKFDATLENFDSAVTVGDSTHEVLAVSVATSTPGVSAIAIKYGSNNELAIETYIPSTTQWNLIGSIARSDDNTTDYLNVAIGIDDSGRVLVQWEDAATSGMTSQYFNQSTWEFPVVHTLGSEYSAKNVMRMNASGSAILVWVWSSDIARADHFGSATPSGGLANTGSDLSSLLWISLALVVVGSYFRISAAKRN